MLYLKQLLILMSIFFTLLLNASELEKVSLQLQWKHQFEFAGFYAAKEKGFYKEIGLDVEFIEHQDNIDQIEEILSGKKTFGIWGSGVISSALEGKEIILLANYFKRSPLILLSQAEIRLPSDLKNKKIMISDMDFKDASLLNMFKKFNVDINSIQRITPSYDINDFINKKVDAYLGFLTNEPLILQKKGISYNIIDPNNFGIEQYDLNLFSSKEYVKNNPNKTKSFIEASNKGWEYALKNKEEIVNLILKKYNTQSKSKELLLFEAEEIEKIMLSKIYPIGSIDPLKVKKISDLLIQVNDKNYHITIDDFIFKPTSLTEQIFTKEERKYLKENRIKIGMVKDYYPFSYSEKGKINGFSYEYFKLLASKANINYDIEINDWSSTLDNFKNKKIDIIDAISYTKNRENFTNFLDSYFQIPNVVFARTDSFNQYKGLNTLRGKKVGITKNIYYFKTIENLKLFELVVFENSREKLKALAHGKIDAAFNNLTSGQKYILQGGYSNIKVLDQVSDSIIKKEDLRLGITKENHILFSIIQKATSLINPTEKLNLINKYFGVNFQQKYNNKTINESTKIKLTKKENEYLKNKKEIRMCVDPNFLPYEKIDKNGKYIGIGADIIQLISKTIDKSIILIPTKTWNETLLNIKDKKCDILPMATITPSREKYMNFTKPYINDSLVIATKTEQFFIKDSKDLSNRKIGVVNGYSSLELLKEKNPNINIVNVESAEDGLRRVQKGELFGHIDALSIIAYAIQKHGFVDLKVAGSLEFDEQLSIASRKDEVLLNTIMQKVLDDIGQEKIRTVVGKWIAIKVQQSFDYTKLIYISFFFIVILAIIIYQNRSIKKINKKLELSNKEIEKKNNLLEKLAITDKLTKLYNRHRLDDVLRIEASRSNRYSSIFGIILIDIDYFKNVNDVYGHQMGDKFLQEFANILKTNFRETDTIGRWGGEEFLIICEQTDVKGLTHLANKIRKEISSYTFSIGEQKTASFGIAIYNENEDIHLLIKRADDALYKAKENGRNRVEWA